MPPQDEPEDGRRVRGGEQRGRDGVDPEGQDLVRAAGVHQARVGVHEAAEQSDREARARHLMATCRTALARHPATDDSTPLPRLFALYEDIAG